MENIISRIKEIADNERITITALEKKIGASKGVLSRALQKNTDIQSKWVSLIVENYPLYDTTWLMTGLGEKIKHSNKIDSVKVGSLIKLKTDKTKSAQTIPLYDIRATAGVVELFNEAGTNHIPIDYITIPNLPKCDGALPITGDSMYPLLKSGDIVLYKEVHDGQNIIWGEMYLVAIIHNGDEFFFAKYIQKSDRDGWIKLVSQNPNHQPKDFPLTSVKALALIKASIRINTAF